MKRVFLALALAVLMGLDLELRRRSGRFEAMSLQHNMESGRLERQFLHPGPDTARGPGWIMSQDHWHQAMFWKYRKAATHPWLPVDPDPPAPP